jgi:lipopolysaccharide transport system ATP-binding protein
MSDIAIQAQNIGKLYRLGDIGTGTLSHDLNRWVAKVRGKEDPYAIIGEVNDRTVKGESDYVWALQDVNFEIKRGEAVGIIGRNGAGKSTLLKILSKVTQPTTGEIKINGRIASLLEVGTGFHPELSGRDNIFLNGAILGMTKKEIKRKFDEIVAFSGVERYIDTPVKRYSSGMYVRLAFAVAAHLESEILIIDEVLSVGDAEFQRKCLGKMNDVQKEGRTVLYVSHQMGTIAQLCNKAFLMQHGKIIKQDHPNRVIDFYLRTGKSSHDGYKAADTNKAMAIAEVFTQSDDGEKTISFTHLQKIIVVIKIYVNKWIKDAELRLVVRDMNGKAIFSSDIALEEKSAGDSNQLEAVAEIPEHFLRPGSFSFTFATFVHNQFIIDLLEDVHAIDIVDGGSKNAASEGLDYGYIFFDPKWDLKSITAKDIISS